MRYPFFTAFTVISIVLLAGQGIDATLQPDLALSEGLEGADGEAPSPKNMARAIPKDPAERPHVVIISMDTTRPDWLEPYGHPWVKTPNIAALAKESLLFKDCLSAAPSTLASHTSIMTGRYPHSHGVPKNGFTVPASNVMLAEALHAAGYHTAGFAAAFPLDARFEFHQGFDYYDDDMESYAGKAPNWARLAERPAKAVTELALGYLDNWRGDAPLFLFVHYFDPHAPYAPEPAFLAMYDDIATTESRPARRISARRLAFLSDGLRKDAASKLLLRYAGELSYMDHHLGRLLDGLKKRNILDNALLLLTSDHGESLWDHTPYFDHGGRVCQTTTHAVGIVRLPGAEHAGSTIRGSMSTTDWMPSILAFLGLPIPEDVDGQAIDFRAATESFSSRPVFSEATKAPYSGRAETWPNLGQERCIRLGRYKLMQAPVNADEQFFDLDADPMEKEDLLSEPAHEHEERVRALRAQLEEWSQIHSGLKATNIKGRREETRERLRALGYF